MAFSSAIVELLTILILGLFLGTIWALINAGIEMMRVRWYDDDIRS